MDREITVSSTLNHFMKSEELEEEDLYLDLQLEFDRDNEEYEIRYGIKESLNPKSRGIDETLAYQSIEEAWRQYKNKIKKLNEEFPAATILAADPEKYNSSQRGGNPAIRIKDQG